jgi:hypothetical protein
MGITTRVFPGETHIPTVAHWSSMSPSSPPFGHVAGTSVAAIYCQLPLDMRRRWDDGARSAPVHPIGAEVLPGKITAQGSAVRSTDAPEARP